MTDDVTDGTRLYSHPAPILLTSSASTATLSEIPFNKMFQSQQQLTATESKYYNVSSVSVCDQSVHGHTQDDGDTGDCHLLSHHVLSQLITFYHNHQNNTHTDRMVNYDSRDSPQDFWA